MREHFDAVTRQIASGLKGGERFLANYRAEDSTFIRFNTSAVRQGGHVHEIDLALTLIDGRRQAEEMISLTGRAGEDSGRIARALDELRTAVAASPEDPYLLVSETPRNSERRMGGVMPEPAEVVDGHFRRPAEPGAATTPTPQAWERYRQAVA